MPCCTSVRTRKIPSNRAGWRDAQSCVASRQTEEGVDPPGAGEKFMKKRIRSRKFLTGVACAAVGAGMAAAPVLFNRGAAQAQNQTMAAGGIGFLLLQGLW